MQKRILAGIVGIICAGLVVWLGFYTIRGGVVFTVLFGIASALVAPFAIAALGYSLRKQDKQLEMLTKVPEIEKLIQQVASQQEKIKKIEELKSSLVSYVKTEAYILAAKERKLLLENDAKRIVDEWEKIDQELMYYEQQPAETDPEIAKLKLAIKQIVKRDDRVRIFGSNLEISGFFNIYDTALVILFNEISQSIRQIRTKREIQKREEK